jgi:hypothetical protein
MRPSQYDSISSPAGEGRKIILDDRYFDDGEGLLQLAQTGRHMLNPYHNLTHELQVVWWSFVCYTNAYPSAVSDDPDDELQHLLMAALFHDHNHSGGRFTDDTNVRLAQLFVSGPAFHGASPAALESVFGSPYAIEQEKRVNAIITVTEFKDGKFTHEPKTLAQRCIRDADLMAIYTVEGRALLVNLWSEMDPGYLYGTTKKPPTYDQRLEFWKRSCTFLTDAEMHTEYGRILQSTYLRDALILFAKRLGLKERHIKIPSK